MRDKRLLSLNSEILKTDFLLKGKEPRLPCYGLRTTCNPDKPIFRHVSQMYTLLDSSD